VLAPEDFPALLNRRVGGGLRGETLEVMARAFAPVFCFWPPLPPTPVTFGLGPGVHTPQLAAGALVSFGTAHQSLANLAGSPLWAGDANPAVPPALATAEGWETWLQTAQRDGVLPADSGWQTLPQRLATAQRWGLTPGVLCALALDPTPLPNLVAYPLELAGLASAYGRPPGDLRPESPPANLPYGGPAVPVGWYGERLRSWVADRRQVVEGELLQQLEQRNLAVAPPWTANRPLPSPLGGADGAGGAGGADGAAEAEQRRFGLNLRVV
jgi:hypothetical protein